MTNFNYLPFLQTEKLMDMGKIMHTNKLFLAFSYCNLFLIALSWDLKQVNGCWVSVLLTQ
jgi:hypothetical protein